MREENEIPRLSRLTAILIQLQSKRVITAVEIARKFGISKRTAYRDIKALEEAGVPIYAEEGKGYSIVDDYNLPPVMFTEEEANALITAAQLISRNKDRSLVSNHERAITKVKAILRYSSKDRAELLTDRIFYMKNLPQEITSDSLSSLQIAITNQTVAKIKYLSIGKEETTLRTVEPQALYHTQENWILIAWCRLRDDYREFRLDRTQTLQLLSESFESRNFDLRSYFGVE